MTFHAGETIVLTADLLDKRNPAYPMTPQPSSVKVKVLDEANPATEHLAAQTMVLISEDTGTSANGSTSNTLKDASKDWAKDEYGNTVENRWAGYLVKITSGPGAGEEKRIISNTADTLTILGSWTVTPTNASAYQIHKARYEYEWDSPVTLENKVVTVQVEATLASGKIDDEQWDLELARRKR